ncbi:MAG: 4Fe-4S dicluster domain-containing protein [Anaerolineales bacterium]|nr:4Fe-4S dicluster domain-containing protein [Anaerolineales bacterium]
MTTQAATPPKQDTPSINGRRWRTKLREFILHAVVQDRVLKRIYPGIMHFMIFWGMTVQILGTIINILQYPLFLPFVLDWPRGSAYLMFELIMDIGGGMIIIGVLMAAFRRLIRRPFYLVNRWDDWYALALLLLISLLGFGSEAVRLQNVNPDWRSWSPIGNLVAGVFTAVGLSGTAAVAVHPVLFWMHAATGMLFVASLPFTKLRHLISGPLNILSRSQRTSGALEPIPDIETAEKLGVGRIDEFQSQVLLMFDACVQCGRCEDVCPATFSGMPYSPRSLMRDLYDTMHRALISTNNGSISELLGGDISKETPWLCTTCGACLSVCPLFIDPVSAAIEMRRYLTLTTGEVPISVGEALTQMERRGNPWGLPKENHAPWIKQLDIRVLQPGEETDVLLFIGCAYAYDSRSQKAGEDFARLLQKADVDFAVLGAAEGCCGETARRLGHEYVFQIMAEENIATLQSVKFNRIVAPCAHCFNTIKNEYAQFGGVYEVQHHTELLSELSKAGKLQTKTHYKGKVFAYHDSCYLGRYNEIYTQPRNTLDSVPNLQRVEFERTMEDGFCCGGGGGHMWMEIDPNTRINHRRLAEAVEVDADIVVTACPYCLIMFDDAIRSKGVGEQISVQDIAEILAEQHRE